ncbi:MAG: hypothetical protein HC914_07930 [Chloroflexaceae bacterium]|nr:hypothetical protein [Chloroflexaceae bacterium]
MHIGMRSFILPFVCLMVILFTAGCGLSQPPAPQPTSTARPTGQLRSAFFGLDNQIPPIRPLLCPDSANQDGMPVVLSHPADPDTLDAADFRVTAADGTLATPVCAILFPAIDAGENRTVLLIGEFGTAEVNEPVRVEVVDEVLSMPDFGTTHNFSGTSITVIPLAAGPTLIDAEILPQSYWILDRAGRQSQGSGCPSQGTRQVVRVKWTGGITRPGGDEIDATEWQQYTVTIVAEDGTTQEIRPFALGNLNDGDNNHDLCLDTDQPVRGVSFPAGLVTDPNEDLNPATSILLVDDIEQ